MKISKKLIKFQIKTFWTSLKTLLFRQNCYFSHKIKRLKSLPWPTERWAKLYICMAMVKSSKLFRNWKKDLNSSKVIPWEGTTIKQSFRYKTSCFRRSEIRWAACVDTDKRHGAKIHTIHNLAPFISGRNLSVCVGACRHQIDDTPKQTKYTLLDFPCAVWTRWAVSGGGRIVAFWEEVRLLADFSKAD